MEQLIRTFVNGGFFYVGFFLAIWGAVDLPWLGPACFLAMFAIHLGYFGSPGHELLFVLIISIGGALLESLFLRFSLISYPGTVDSWPPLWLISIYGMYAMTVDHSLRWLREHKALVGPLGAAGAILSYIAGSHMGACTFLVATPYFLMVSGSVWALFAPLTFCLRERIGSE